MFGEDDNGKEDLKIDPELLRNFMLGGVDYKDGHTLSEASNVIDLHLSEKEDKRYNGAEKFYFQIEQFQKKLDRAIACNLDKLIVIHGKGSGKLKEEINTILAAHPCVKSYRLMHEPKYAYGATEIIL